MPPYHSIVGGIEGEVFSETRRLGAICGTQWECLSPAMPTERVLNSSSAGELCPGTYHVLTYNTVLSSKEHTRKVDTRHHKEVENVLTVTHAHPLGCAVTKGDIAALHQSVGEVVALR